MYEGCIEICIGDVSRDIARDVSNPRSCMGQDTSPFATAHRRGCIKFTACCVDSTSPPECLFSAWPPGTGTTNLYMDKRTS